MVIKTPIYYVKIEGNLKEIVSELPDVIIASYEEHINKTFVVLKASEENLSKEVLKYFYRLHYELPKQAKVLKQNHVEVKYSKEGIDFKTL